MCLRPKLYFVIEGSLLFRVLLTRGHAYSKREEKEEEEVVVL